MAILNPIKSLDSPPTSNNNSEENAPAWGSLPVEQYILQGDALVKAFINEDVTGSEYQSTTHVPTQQEINTILKPWRPQKIRAIAAKRLSISWPDFKNEGFCVLRTWYQDGEEADAKLEEWFGYDELKGLSEVEIEETLLNRDRQGGDKMKMKPKNRWWMVLDDKDMIDIFPELAAPSVHRRLNVIDALDNLHLDGTPYPRKSEPSEEAYEDAVLEVASGGLRYPLVILNQEAFETGQIYLAWRDAKGKVVKDIRDDIAGLPYLQHDIHRVCAYEIGWWTEACFGKQYDIHGEKGKMMRKLLPLVKEAAKQTMAHNAAMYGW
ncbi:hypothetical protein QC761_501920 [Podospora bellae-mahoneyi]|uniref:Uncharacterized protein n=1 Tax=Podospora bellae-mahoneyi TaxID=2093777 RepID=A0ABR0FCD7_9PEZI|nr:hypothetical protein QC761_501920 [Podospora bellae-mahoneyi]